VLIAEKAPSTTNHKIQESHDEVELSYHVRLMRAIQILNLP
jgi:hypothetical protein